MRPRYYGLNRFLNETRTINIGIKRMIREIVVRVVRIRFACGPTQKLNTFRRNRRRRITPQRFLLAGWQFVFDYLNV